MLSELRLAFQFHTQRQEVDAMGGKAVAAFALPRGKRHTRHDFILPAEPVQKHVVAGQQRRKQRATVLRADLSQIVHQRLIDHQASGPAIERSHRRTWPIAGQIQGWWRRLKLLEPEFFGFRAIAGLLEPLLFQDKCAELRRRGGLWPEAHFAGIELAQVLQH